MIAKWLQSSRVARLQPYIASLLLTGIGLALTAAARAQDDHSPFLPFLFLPVVLGILTCSFAFVATHGILLGITVILLDMLLPRLYPTVFLLPYSPLNSVVNGILIAGIALIGGLYATHLRQQQSLLTDRLKKADDLLNLSMWISTSNSLEDMIDVILATLSQIQPYHKAAVFLTDEAQSLLVAEGVRGDGADLSFTRMSVRDANLCGLSRAFAPCYIRNAEREYALPMARLVPGVRSCAALPLYLNEETLVGALYVGFEQPNALSPDDCQLLQDFALRIAFPLQKTRLQERLQGLAFTDAMTGLQNFRAFRAQLDEEIRRAHRYHHPVSLLALDLDHFKRINDRYGHPTGDRVLAHLAAILRQSLRETDIPARYGGEEFVVICPETTQEEARIVAERIRQAIQATPLLDSPDRQIAVTVSVGLASYPQHAPDETTLMSLADKALYHAKRSGRNCVCIAGPADEESPAQAVAYQPDTVARTGEAVIPEQARPARRSGRG